MKGIRSLRNVPKRCYAAARTTDFNEPFTNLKTPSTTLLPAQNVQVSKLPNGLVIASLENNSPLSSICMFVKAGSRYETLENQGVSHVLRLAANLTTKGASAFRICRGLEALGGSLSVTSSRETMVYTMQCLRDQLDSLMEYLVDVTTAQDFRPWEVADLTSRVKLDKALLQQCPQIGVIEKLHEAAYKNALSNSLYCPDHMVGHISCKQLQSFTEDNFTAGRMALVGLGVKHSVLKQVGEGLLNVRSGGGAPQAKAVYRGGELRVQTSDDLVHALIASEGGVTGTEEANAFSVLQRILGAGPCVKRGSNITSKLTQGIAKATMQPFDATAFNASYSDAGLFGVYIIAQAQSAGEAIKAAITQVRSVAERNLTEADITRAKKQLKTDYLMSMESSETLLEEIGAQALANAAYQPPDAALETIDAVTQEAVVNAAKKFVDGKKTMAACGQLKTTPFVDEI
ncbi:ubiquinol-cytochrome c reductase core protein 2a isoform X2 [Antennarius striatus]|uniref:ubiquinol-cytochrome c reductase core protein 2a isoform X2 n=1 Tax=Antennarius striatus TaxID=241820 RepID=UPI0035AF6201